MRGRTPNRGAFGAMLVGALAAALACAGGASAAVAPAGSAVRPLLPDLDQEAPYSLALTRRAGRLLLAFGSATNNVGAGPLTVAGRRAAARPAMRTWQVISRSDGSRVRRDLGTLLRYERAPTHEHWHLHAFARYELRSPARPRVVIRSQKAGFCLGDRYDADPTTRLPREPRRPRWTHHCGLGQVGATRMLEGISVGYGDDYAPGLEGQHVDVTSVRAGRYLLVHRSNPRGLIRELDTTNNAASVLLELRRPATGRPRFRILGRCPGSASCVAR